MFKQIMMYDPRETRLPYPAGYELNAKGPFARLLTWLWRKAIAKGFVVEHFEDKIEYRRVLIDERRIPDQILHAIETVYYHRQTPSEVLMGPATFRELMADKTVRDSDMFSYDLTAQNGRTVFGIKVHVLPWMEGLLVR